MDKALKARFDTLDDEQLARKVAELKQTIPALNEQLDYANRMLRDRRAAAAKKAIDDARKRSTS